MLAFLPSNLGEVRHIYTFIDLQKHHRTPVVVKLKRVVVARSKTEAEAKWEIDMRFMDKAAIITGGSSGIGKEVARRFVSEGGAVVINGRDAAKAAVAAKEIDTTGERAVAQEGDISVPATGQALVNNALDRFGRLDVLFNNAGIFAPKPFIDVDESDYDRFLDIRRRPRP